MREKKKRREKRSRIKPKRNGKQNQTLQNNWGTRDNGTHPKMKL